MEQDRDHRSTARREQFGGNANRTATALDQRRTDRVSGDKKIRFGGLNSGKRLRAAVAENNLGSHHVGGSNRGKAAKVSGQLCPVASGRNHGRLL